MRGLAVPPRAVLVLGGLLALLTGCGGERGAPEARHSAAAARQGSIPPRSGSSEVGETELRRRAAAAMRAGRLYAPAGDNAVEHYLVLRERAPEDAGVRGALTELQPYLLIAAEQALASAAFEEAQRLLELIASNDPGAPALPRLHESLRNAWTTAERQRAAKATPTAVPGQTEALVPAGRPVAPEDPAPGPPEIVGVDADGTRSVPPRPPEQALEPTTERDAARAPSRQSPAAPSPPAEEPAAATAATTPRLLEDSLPRYPLILLNRRVEGQVVVVVDIAADGRVADAKVQSAQPEEVFDRAALAAARRWRFEPGEDGRIVARTLRFTLPADGGSR